MRRQRCTLHEFNAGWNGRWNPWLRRIVFYPSGHSPEFRYGMTMVCLVCGRGFVPCKPADWKPWFPRPYGRRERALERAARKRVLREQRQKEFFPR